MSIESPINNSILSGSGDASIASNPLSLVDKGRNLDDKLLKDCTRNFHANAKEPDEFLKCIEKLNDQVNEEQKRPLRRSITLTDMTPPHKNKRRQINDEKIIKTDKITVTNKQIIMTKILSILYYKLWKRKRSEINELQEQVNQLLVQKMFLNQMREKESNKRDELTNLTERQKRDMAEYKIEIIKLKEERDDMKTTMKNMENSLNEIQLELEKTIYIKDKLQKDNNEYLENMQRINDEFVHLKTENKDQKRKILYMNNVADQQDQNLKQLYRIAEDLDLKLKEKVEIVRNAIRRRDKAIDKEELANYNLKLLETNLCDSKDAEKKLKARINELKEIASESEKRKILVTLENVDLKYKLEEVEALLKKVTNQIHAQEMQMKYNDNKLWIEMKKKFLNIPWLGLFHLGIYFFPAISTSCSR